MAYLDLTIVGIMNGDTPVAKIMKGDVQKWPCPYDAEVEYLQCTGTQYIDVGLIPVAGDIATIKFQAVDRTAGIFFGSRYSTSSQKFMVGISSDNNIIAALGTHGNVSLADYDALEHTVVLDTTNGTATLDGTIVKSVGSFVRSDWSIGIFGGNLRGTFTIGAHIKIMSVTIGNKMDLIPVRKDGVGYMYDRVSGVMFGNDGTGDLIIGPDK